MMFRIWNKIKVGQEYTLAILMYALTVFAFATGDNAAGWVSFAIATGSFLLMKALKWTERTPASGGELPSPRTFEEGEVRVLLSKGMEPVPIPGESEQHVQDCHICKRFKETL